MRRYDPQPPAPTNPTDVASYTLKLASLKVDPAAKGWKKYKISLSNDVRGLHLANPIHADDWRGLVTDFDKKLLVMF